MVECIYMCMFEEEINAYFWLITYFVLYPKHSFTKSPHRGLKKATVFLVLDTVFKKLSKRLGFLAILFEMHLFLFIIIFFLLQVYPKIEKQLLNVDFYQGFFYH